MLHLQHVSFAYGSGPEVLYNLNLELSPGDRIVLAGRSGSGKSTLLRLAAKLLNPSSGYVVLNPEVTHNGIGYVRQQPENQLVAGTVAEEVAFALEYRDLIPQEIKERVEEALSVTGLSDLAERTPNHLSGGQMQRLAFAAAWAMQPKLWLLDEPTAFLDPDGRERLHELVKSLPHDTAVLYIASGSYEYDLLDKLALLKDGSIQCVGHPRELAGDGKFEETGLQIPVAWRLEGLDSGEGYSQPVARGAQTAFDDEKLRTSGEVHFTSELPLKNCEVVGVNARRSALFAQGVEVLNGLDLELKSGEVTALVGPSGAGKTTLLEVLAGLQSATKGDIRWDGVSPKDLKGRIGVAFQFPERSFFAESVLAEVAYGPRNLGASQSEAERIAANALRDFGFDPGVIGECNPFELSGGQARRVALAVVWALHPRAYLLDEPTAGLDDDDARIVGGLLSDIARKGYPVIVAGHDIDRFAEWTDRWLLLRGGVIARDGHGADWWSGDEGSDPWPAPATVQAWRQRGLDMKTIPGTDAKSVIDALTGLQE